MRSRIIAISLFVLCLAGCQYDDICPDKTPTTPRLIIKFMDNDHPNRTKAVENFNAKALSTDSLYFEKPVTDTIVALPLKTYAQETRYALIINQEDSINQKTDTINFTYTSEEVYISRACGFKDEFSDFSATLSDNDTVSPWIKHIETPHPNHISDEKTTHLYLYH